MLQVNALRAFPPALSPGDAGSRSFTLSVVRTVLRRYAALVMACALTGALLATIYVLLSVPTYIAGAQLLIEPQRQQQLLVFEPGMLDLTLDNAQVESQVEVLRSERLAGAVVDDLKLTRDPEFQIEGSPLGQPPAPSAESAAVARSEAEKRRIAISILISRVGTRRIGQSYVLETTAQSYRPERAAEIANGYMHAYLQDQYEAKAQMARGGVEWLQVRLREVRGNLTNAARAVEDFRTRNGLVATSNGLLNEQQLGEMNSQFVAARAQTANAAARLARVREVTAKTVADASVAEVLNNQAIINLRQRQQDASQRESDLRARYGNEAEAVMSAHRDVLAAEQAISVEVQRISQVYQSEHEIASAREKAMAEEIQRLIGEADRLRQAKVTLSELDAQAQSYRKMYQNLLEKLAETTQKETLPVTSARVIAPASVPLGKNTPKAKLAITLGIALGLLVGIGAGIVRERLDNSVGTEADIRGAGPITVLGLMPSFGRLPRRWWRSSTANRPGLEVTERPFSGFSRALRGVKLALDVMRDTQHITTLGIASIAHGDGKSTVAFNLAALFAQSSCRTLIIDADFRDPSLTKRLTPLATQGLLQMVEGECDAIRPTSIENLSFLPLVIEEPIAFSSDLLRSARMQALLNRLKGNYDLVLVDLTAMQSAMDVRAVARQLDGLLLVTAWRATDRRLLSEAIAALDAAQANLVGAVLNKVRDPALVARNL